MTIDYDKLTDDFEDGAINTAEFKHIDHVGVAYVMLDRYDFLTATFKYAQNIHAMALRGGARRKFNATITIAFLSIIAERRGTSVHTDVYDFIARNQDLITSNPLEQRYSAKRLLSDQARSTFLLPDRVA